MSHKISTIRRVGYIQVPSKSINCTHKAVRCIHLVRKMCKIIFKKDESAYRYNQINKHSTIGKVWNCLWKDIECCLLLFINEYICPILRRCSKSDLLDWKWTKILNVRRFKAIKKSNDVDFTSPMDSGENESNELNEWLKIWFRINLWVNFIFDLNNSAYFEKDKKTVHHKGKQFSSSVCLFTI